MMKMFDVGILGLTPSRECAAGALPELMKDATEALAAYRNEK